MFYDIVSLSSVQVNQLHLYTHPLRLGFPSHVGHHRMSSAVPWATQEGLLSCLFFFKYLSLVNHSVVSYCLRPHGLQQPGSSVHGVLQARTLGWAAASVSGGIFPTQGWGLCLLRLLHQQVGSLPLAPPGKSSVLYIV